VAGRHSKRNHRSNDGKARRRRWAVGLDTGAGAVLAFGLAPFSSAPAAHADEFDVIIDPIINSLAGLVDPLVALDPFRRCGSGQSGPRKRAPTPPRLSTIASTTPVSPDHRRAIPTVRSAYATIATHTVP
jgi:hypothetical protein